MKCLRTTNSLLFLGLFCAIVGAFVELDPHQFASHVPPGVRQCLPLLEDFFLIIGLALLCAVSLSGSHRAVSAAHLLALQTAKSETAEEVLRKTNADLSLKIALQTAQIESMDLDLQEERKSHRQTEQKLKQASEDLVRANKDLEDFAYVASHDLQEPLRVITSYLQLIQKRYHHQIDQAADEFIDFAVGGAQRMKNLIIDLLAYARAGGHLRAFRPTDVSVVLDHALASLREPLKESGASVIQAPLPTVLADNLQMSQVFQNLIGNAIKFHNGHPPEVKVAAWQEEDAWIFSVTDNGIGIPPQYYERIFGIFERLHGQNDYPGTGMGLALCRKIIERHGGRIWLDSEPGKGSTFYFSLPIAKSPEQLPTAE